MKTITKLNKCLSIIQSKEIRDWTRNWLENETPSYFWEIPASSTGKYHPKYALGAGGVVRHTIASAKIAKDLLLNLEPYRSWPRNKKDCILSALILHDTRKHGYPSKSKYSNASHGADLADAILEKQTSDFQSIIASLIASHMGRWNTSYRGNRIVAPKPETPEEHFVHLCDYLASRKYLPVDFDNLH